MKRPLFFIGLLAGGVFLHWSIIVFFAAIFALIFYLPLELIFIGLFLDSLILTSPPSAFTFGFLAIIIAEEFLKIKIKEESRLGKMIIISSGLLIFSVIFVYLK